MKMFFSEKGKKLLSLLLITVLSTAVIFVAVKRADSSSGVHPADDSQSEEKGSDPFDDSKIIYIKKEGKSDLSKDDIVKENTKKSSVSTIGIINSENMIPSDVAVRNAGNLAAEGYRLTDSVYDSSVCEIGEFFPSVSLPDSFSLRKKTIQDVSYTQPKDYADFEATYTEREVDRPAIEMYMGYLFVDNGETLDIYTSSGNYMMSFDDSEYIPAYARDRGGNPLFYRPSSRLSGQTTWESVEFEKDKPIEVVRDRHKKEDYVRVKGKGINIGLGNAMSEECKAFYTIGYGGFGYSSYREEIDSRGVNYDYPPYYGISDNGLALYVETYNTYLKKHDESVEMKHSYDWTFTWGGIPINKEDDGKKNREKTFDRAYNFSEGLACVITEPYYRDGGLFFISSSGNRAFESYKKVNNNFDRYVVRNFMPPISYGKESIGYFYYDHGLVRVRLEELDPYNMDEYNIKLKNSTKEILIDRNGREFYIPEGFNIISYSNGMIELEHDGKYGFMNYKNEWIAEPVYKSSSYFSEGLGVLETDDGRYGVIDADGNVVLPFSFDYITPVSSGVFAAYSHLNGWHIYYKMAK